MSQMVLAVFSNRDNADSAVTELQTQGFNPKDISVIMRNPDDSQKVVTTQGGSKMAEGSFAGATTGGLVGALAGLLVGVGAIIIPGIGGILIGGPIAAALGLTGAAATTISGAVTGVLAGGLVGALASLGLPENEARIYENKIREGAVLIAVPVTNEQSQTAVASLQKFHPDQLDTVNSTVNS
ncbi:MAG TPA: general stress protein [Patescibacteria group bacterium]